MSRSKREGLVKKSSDTTIATAEDVKAPEWIADKEDIGTSMMETGQEMLLAIDDVLIRFFGFDDPIKFKALIEDWTSKSIPEEEQAPSLKVFHDRLNYILSGMAEYEEYGPDIISPASVKQVGNIVSRIAEVRLKKNLLKRDGQAYPMLMPSISLVAEIEGLVEKILEVPSLEGRIIHALEGEVQEVKKKRKK